MAKVIGTFVVYGLAVIGAYALARWHHTHYQKKAAKAACQPAEPAMG